MPLGSCITQVSILYLRCMIICAPDMAVDVAAVSILYLRCGAAGVAAAALLARRPFQFSI